MTAICLIDTSVFVEILNVPSKAQSHQNTLQALGERVQKNETLFLPMATIIETGSHVGQNGSGSARRSCAQRFVQQVTAALKGSSPFRPISFLQPEHMAAWLQEFPDHAMGGSGLGDLSIVHDWQRLCALNAGRRVYIWSFDGHLAAFDRPATI